MQDITLDVRGYTDRRSLHEYLRDALDMPPYYGCNLDALHSELASITETTRITVLYSLDSGIFSDYVRRLMQVFEDASEENTKLKVELIREKEF